MILAYAVDTFFRYHTLTVKQRNKKFFNIFRTKKEKLLLYFRKESVCRFLGKGVIHFMYAKDSYVFHLRCGVCYVKDIAPLSDGDSKDLYYVLSPLYGDSKTNIVRVPVNNPSSLRLPLTKPEAEEIVKNLPSFQTDLYIVDSKARKVAYESALASGDISKMAPLIAGAKQRKIRDGHLNSMDGLFVSRAEPIVYGELALALSMPYDQVPGYLESRL